MLGQGKLIVVIGLQFGSEGKGAITDYYSPILSGGIRVGAANAGHTAYFKGKPYVMRQLPAVWMNPVASLFIGRSAIISLDVLLNEIEWVHALVPVKHRLYIDGDAFVTTEKAKALERNLTLESSISSTSSKANLGIGTTQALKVLRVDGFVKAKDVPELKPYIRDTSVMIYQWLSEGQYLLLEGTQGHSLSIEFGLYPFVTSRDTTAANLASSVGLPLHRDDVFRTHVIGVMRTFPIRVAGNSGPFYEDSKEVTWQYVSKFASRQMTKRAKIREFTSVTGAERRVATISLKQINEAIRINGVDEIAGTFLDYLDYRHHNDADSIGYMAEAFCDTIERQTGVSVGLVKNGPMTIHDTNWYRANHCRKLRYW